MKGASRWLDANAAPPPPGATPRARSAVAGAVRYRCSGLMGLSLWCCRSWWLRESFRAKRWLSGRPDDRDRGVDSCETGGLRGRGAAPCQSEANTAAVRLLSAAGPEPASPGV